MQSQMHCLRPTARNVRPVEGAASVPLSAKMKYRTTDHSVYNLNYHIVLVTNSGTTPLSPYRNKVLSGAVEEYLKDQVYDICDRYGWDVLALEVMPGHVHLFVSSPPKIAPMVVARTVKSILAVSVFRQFPTLKRWRFWGSGLWSRGTYYGSAGTVSGATIMRYIEQQKDA
jgi:putative transposase